MACQKLGQMVQKNEDISESVNSFDTGIFRPRSGHDLSRNVSVVSGYAFYKNSNCRKGFLHDSEIDKKIEKVLSGEPKLNFSGPAEGSRTTRVHSPPDTNIHMTRRAFLRTGNWVQDGVSKIGANGSEKWRYLRIAWIVFCLEYSRDIFEDFLLT